MLPMGRSHLSRQLRQGEWRLRSWLGVLPNQPSTLQLRDIPIRDIQRPARTETIGGVESVFLSLGTVQLTIQPTISAEGAIACFLYHSET
jgi:hypothetical protein